MRRCVPAAVFAILLFTGRTAFASSFTAGDTVHVLNDGGTIFGGVFNVHNSTTNPSPDLDSIQLMTFCLQHEQDMSKDDFKVESSTGFVTDDGETLDNRAAWIYSQYSQALLSTYSENDIQAAIWVIQNQAHFRDDVFPTLDPSIQSNAQALMTAAAQAVDPLLGGTWVNTDVRVLVLTYLNPSDGLHVNGEQAQDFLVITGGGVTTTDDPVPEPATVLLVGSGAAALIRRRVKNRRNS